MLMSSLKPFLQHICKFNLNGLVKLLILICDIVFQAERQMMMPFENERQQFKRSLEQPLTQLRYARCGFLIQNPICFSVNVHMFSL